MRRKDGHDEGVEAYYDAVSSIYDRREEDAMQRMVIALTWPWILGNLPSQQSRILDAGGGTGRWAIPLAKEGHRVVILDISQRMLDQAREKVRRLGLTTIECRKGNFEDIPYPDESFDVVLCEGDAFGLTANPRKALRQFGRVLVKGGVLLLGVSNALNLIIIKSMGKKTVDPLAGFLERFSHKEPSPDRLAAYYGTARTIGSIDGPRFATFTPHQIGRMVEEAGFSQISILPRITFVDYLDSQVLDEAARDQELFGQLLQLEQRVMQVEGSVALGGHLLVKATKTAPMQLDRGMRSETRSR